MSDQLQLLPEVKDVQAHMLERHEFTGEMLKVRRPDIYKAILNLSALGWGQIRIGRLLSCSPDTVRAVQKNEGMAISIEKEGLAVEFADAARLALEWVKEGMSDPEKRDETSVKDRVIVAKMSADAALACAGEAVQRVEVSIAIDAGGSAMRQYLQDMGDGAGILDVMAQPVGTGGTGGTGGAAGGSVPGAALPVGVPGGQSHDAESGDCCGNSIGIRGAGERVATLVATLDRPAGDPALRQAGGEGVPVGDGGGGSEGDGSKGEF